MITDSVQMSIMWFKMSNTITNVESVNMIMGGSTYGQRTPTLHKREPEPGFMKFDSALDDKAEDDDID
ncbi:hypothetical protein SERLA73DRAFT_184086 [Serpula lacrymans var. lacrymans S7.3]|uniref:Uncharacterized protein n=2 Tax=Serpula lacrymans var. lacrymans TaxID=341189 RepID=F8Q2I0_SERL3|nr:uncharacterized protein SERLADRAFT_471579 [Serpula lacrymans var. lacrymans S7.9]EGN97391.1 hypothetical protein SERLA73DRAFT_184086 [Serpula lacrymans var. lacrymans S7.3]EGO22982.1 hypothetical protein SERLADRAFT_471579 [Serpula lacrymans var. lacrymans S7.9]